VKYCSLTLFDQQIYKKQFEAAVEANNWSSSDKTTALEVLQTLDESRYKNYGDLIQHQKMRFGNKHLEQVYEAQL